MLTRASLQWAVCWLFPSRVRSASGLFLLHLHCSYRGVPGREYGPVNLAGAALERWRAITSSAEVWRRAAEQCSKAKP